VEMSVDALMQIYLSIGVLAGSVVPDRYRLGREVTPEPESLAKPPKNE